MNFETFDRNRENLSIITTQIIFVYFLFLPFGIIPMWARKLLKVRGPHGP
jgi:hypothetical protein